MSGPDFAGLVRNLLHDVASPLVDSFKDDVTWTTFGTEDGRGGIVPGTRVTSLVKAIVSRKRKVTATSGGDRLVVEATLLFVDPLTSVGGRDTFTLSDGTTAPIVAANGEPLDPLTHQGFVTEIQLGTVVRGE